MRFDRWMFVAAVVAMQGCSPDGGAFLGWGSESLTAAEPARPSRCGDTAADSANCGACGVACSDGTTCVLGLCVDDSKSVSVATASGPSAVTLSGSWYERGPFIGGRLDGIDVASSSWGLPWLAVGSAGGGVWQMIDLAGQTWAEANGPGLGDLSIMHLERDVIDNSRLYARTWGALFVTTNMGSNWTGLVGSGWSPGPLQPGVSEVEDPKPFGQIKFSSTQRAIFFARPCEGIWYSFDGTNFSQWLPFSGGETNLDNCIGNVAADSVSKRVYFSTMKAVASEPAHVYRSCAWSYGTPCTSVTAANQGLPTNKIVSSLTSVAYGSYGDRVMAATQTGSGGTNTWLTTNGTSWSQRATLASQWTPRPLVYAGPVGTNQEVFHGNVDSYYSSNLGSSWTGINIASQHVDTRAVGFHTGYGKVYTANDGAHADQSGANIVRWNWTPGSAPYSGAAVTHQGLRAWQAYFAGVVPPASPSSPRRVFVGSQDNEAVCSDNGGSTWTLGTPLDIGDVWTMAFAPSNPDRAYFRTNDGSIRRSSTARSAASCSAVSSSWTKVLPPEGAGNPSYWHRNTLAVHPLYQDRIYLVGGSSTQAIGVSVNAGANVTWHALPNGYRATCVEVDSAGTIYAGTADHGAYYSVDNGSSWTAWGLNSGSPAVILAIKRSGGASPTWWMATTSGLYRKLWGGSWQGVNNPSRYVINDVVVDPNCATRVYAAFGFIGRRQYHRGGIQASTNNGGTWFTLTGGYTLHGSPITDVEVDAADPKLVYAATYGRGLWTWDWGTSLPFCQ